MDLRGRQTRSADFAEAAHLITDRFVYEDGDVVALFQMWQAIIDGESGYSSVVVGPEPGRLLAFGISVALKAEFLESLLADPQPFVAARILRAWKSGEGPFMTCEELAQANAGWGVDLFVLHHGYAQMSEAAANYGVIMALAAEFQRQHAGLNLRSMTQEFYDRAWLDMNARFGFCLRADFLHHPSAAHLPPKERPFMGGIRRSEVVAPGRPDFATNTLFANFPAPRLALDREQRRFLRAELEDESDVRAGNGERWDTIYDSILRVDSSVALGPNSGSERRRRILAWIRSHPEELHPHAMPDAMP